MLRALRIRLSLLYLVASLSLVALLGAATYGLLTLYFQRATDLALQYKMATEFRTRGLSLPPALTAAEQAWMQGSNRTVSTVPQVTTSSSQTSSSDGSDEREGDGGSVTPAAGQTGGDGEDRYDGNLAPVFVLPPAGSAAVSGEPIVADPAAVAYARQSGSDLRTVKLNDGARLRLLTYNIGGGAVLQVGRLLNDQDSLLSQYLAGLLILGSIASLLLALASWVLAGRSIKPAQRAWDQQQQFISNASHELRTPLTLMRANADYALRSSSADEREESLHDIVDEVDYMNRLVEDLLLLSRLDAHRLTLADESIVLPDLLNETARQVEKLSTAKGVSLSVESSAGTVRGDRVRLRQVLLILLDNALRFTPSGGTIRMSSQWRNRELVITVADSGSGIPPEHLSHIFERFYQVPERTGDGRGNGLGLSIAKGLVEAQHGKISITSQPGKGTSAQIVFSSG
jgi:signal transduction histidine kinase